MPRYNAPKAPNDNTPNTEDSMQRTQIVPPPTRCQPSYHPTRWPIANSLLELLDRLSNGRADWFQRLITFLFSGGIAAIVNLAVFALVLQRKLPVNDVAHNLIAYIVAAEASTITGFLLNDWLTFRHLPGHARPWLIRCARFHVTVAVGTLLTYIIQFALHYLLRIQPIVAEAIAIIIVTFFNFAFHHIFTYRSQHAPESL
jgi:putative flippase GtrA